MTTTIKLLPESELVLPQSDAGFGALNTPLGNLPLRQMDVQARITGLLSQLELRQTFVNTLEVPVEATYVFPLPDRAAVSRFRLEVGERVVEGELQERGQARRAYDQALRQGHRAAITEEDRAGVFTMRVGNLLPGDEATVWLTLGGPLPCASGEATFRFPLVVAPRYVPGRTLSGEQAGLGVQLDTDAVPDASRISPPVLLPGVPNPVRLSVRVEIDAAGFELGRIRSSLHAVTTRHSSGRTVVELNPGERLDRDVVLRIQLGAPRQQSSLIAVADPERPDAGTFALTLLPPAQADAAARPRDVVFVLDRSGSMEGWKMVAARRATARMVDSLSERDRFAVLAFDDRIDSPRELPSHALHLASDRNRFRAVEFLAGVEPRGGTELGQPLLTSAQLLADPSRERVLVLITDGQVGNEDQILRALTPALERVRVFALGIDQAVNAAFLRRLADLGRGACELVESEDRLDEVLEHVHRQIATPLVSRIELTPESGALDPDTLVPARLPDLFPGAPLTIQGRFEGVSPQTLRLRIRGQSSSGQETRETIAAQPSDATVIAQAWARGQIRELEDRFVIARSPGERQELERRIVATSLSHSVLCRFTAFVAVDRAEVVNEGGQQHQVIQAVETPRGWDESEARLGATRAVSLSDSAEELELAGEGATIYSQSLDDDFEQDSMASSRMPIDRAARFVAADEDHAAALEAFESAPADPFEPSPDSGSFDSLPPTGSAFGGVAGGSAFGGAPADPFGGPALGGDPFGAGADPFASGDGLAPAPQGEEFLLDDEGEAPGFDPTRALDEAPPPPPASARPPASMPRMPAPPAQGSAAPPPRLSARDLPELPAPAEEEAERRRELPARAKRQSAARSDARRAGRKAEEAEKKRRRRQEPKQAKQGFFGRLRDALSGKGSKPGEVSKLEAARRRLIAVRRELELLDPQPRPQRVAAMRRALPELRDLVRELEGNAVVPAKLLRDLAELLDAIEAMNQTTTDREADRVWKSLREALHALRKVLAPSSEEGRL